MSERKRKSSATRDKKNCKAITEKKTRCGNLSLPGLLYCYKHDPAAIAQRNAQKQWSEKEEKFSEKIKEHELKHQLYVQQAENELERQNQELKKRLETIQSQEYMIRKLEAKLSDSHKKISSMESTQIEAVKALELSVTKQKTQYSILAWEYKQFLQQTEQERARANSHVQEWQAKCKQQADYIKQLLTSQESIAKYKQDMEDLRQKHTKYVAGSKLEAKGMAQKIKSYESEQQSDRLLVQNLQEHIRAEQAKTEKNEQQWMQRFEEQGQKIEQEQVQKLLVMQQQLQAASESKLRSTDIETGYMQQDEQVSTLERQLHVRDIELQEALLKIQQYESS